MNKKEIKMPNKMPKPVAFSKVGFDELNNHMYLLDKSKATYQYVDEKVNNCEKKLSGEISAATIENAKTLVDKYKHIIIILLAVVAGGWTLYSSLRNEIKDTKTEIKSDMKEMETRLINSQSAMENRLMDAINKKQKP